MEEKSTRERLRRLQNPAVRKANFWGEGRGDAQRRQDGPSKKRGVFVTAREAILLWDLEGGGGGGKERYPSQAGRNQPLWRGDVDEELLVESR